MAPFIISVDLKDKETQTCKMEIDQKTEKVVDHAPPPSPQDSETAQFNQQQHHRQLERLLMLRKLKLVRRSRIPILSTRVKRRSSTFKRKESRTVDALAKYLTSLDI